MRKIKALQNGLLRRPGVVGRIRDAIDQGVNESVEQNIVAKVKFDTVPAYRIVELDAHNRPKTLFHALPDQGDGRRRSRILPTDKWLYAEVKPVTDGTSKSVYQSGFNVLLELDAMRAYLKRFKKDRTLAIIEIEVDKTTLRPKQHSRSPVFLARYMRIPHNWTVICTNRT